MHEVDAHFIAVHVDTEKESGGDMQPFDGVYYDLNPIECKPYLLGPGNSDRRNN